MKRILLTLVLTTLSFSSVAFAQSPQTEAPTLAFTQTTPVNNNPGFTQTTPVNNNAPTPVSLINPLGSGTSLPNLLTDILQFVVQIGTIIVILSLVYIGFLFVTAQGNETKIKNARGYLFTTIIGALILLGAEAIAQGIQATVAALSVGK